MFSGEHRIFVAVKNAVAALLRMVFSPEEPPVPLLKLFQFFCKRGFVHFLLGDSEEFKANEKFELSQLLRRKKLFFIG